MSVPTAWSAPHPFLYGIAYTSTCDRIKRKPPVACPAGRRAVNERLGSTGRDDAAWRTHEELPTRSPRARSALLVEDADGSLAGRSVDEVLDVVIPA
jgi:hypothetical protein